jgi:hypothetical protein
MLAKQILATYIVIDIYEFQINSGFIAKPDNNNLNKKKSLKRGLSQSETSIG